MVGLQSVLPLTCLRGVVRPYNVVAGTGALDQTGLDLNPAAIFSELCGQDTFPLGILRGFFISEIGIIIPTSLSVVIIKEWEFAASLSGWYGVRSTLGDANKY